MNINNEIELNIDKIAHLAISREQENIQFCALLNNSDSIKIDKLVHQLNSEISSKIDCTECGNCCKKATPCLSERDLKRLSVASGIDENTLLEKHTTLEDEDRVFKSKPCMLLKENKCTVYALRPDDCRGYPHLDKKDFTNRLWNILEHYGICPIVFNVFEQLKNELDT